MIHRRFAAALATAAMLAAPGAALAATPEAVSQTAYQAAPAAPAQVPTGLAITAVRDWLISVGASVSEITREDGRISVTVTDGPMTWLVFFNGCEADVCGDIQYMAAFSNDTITAELVNQWNLEHRFLKAYYTPGAAAGAAGAAIVQYDVLLVNGVGTEQLIDPTSVWVGVLPSFATHVGFFVPEAAPAQ
ncbi:YbjN domain-containing protein [uncultured Brevundimonas sp.]|uniref:YbjN domain-containing protein n=1 Tax=uncultured Brevundimonas sp. TaxID=213418 RepID=UPI0030EBF9EB|tara:strand:+ start:14989 stop:15558 length:570 start_codon:yes stop_codon:yes gene_type:complete